MTRFIWVLTNNFKGISMKKTEFPRWRNQSGQNYGYGRKLLCYANYARTPLWMIGRDWIIDWLMDSRKKVTNWRTGRPSYRNARSHVKMIGRDWIGDWLMDFRKRVTDRPTDGQTSYRDARTYLTSPTWQRCVLTVSLRVLTLELDLDRQTDEELVSNEDLKIFLLLDTWLPPDWKVPKIAIFKEA